VPDTFIRGPLDGTGERWRTRTRAQGANTVHEAYVVAGALPTYYYSTIATGAGATAAQNKIFFEIFNASGSGRIVRVKKLFVQTHIAVVTGVSIVFDLDTTSAVGTGGTTLTGRSVDSADASIPAQVTARHAPSGGATKNFTHFSTPYNAEETQPAAFLSGFFNLIPEGVELKEPCIREGEGLRLIQITNSTAGTFSVVAAVTIEPSS
jgi:hypothetical protein